MCIKLTRIYSDKIKRKQFLKSESKKIILQSILQNFEANDIIRLMAIKKIIFLKKKGHLSRQNNMCLLTSRFGGVFKSHDISRHMMKKFGKFNMLHNVKMKSW
jgi:ribosomal protein S14